MQIAIKSRDSSKQSKILPQTSSPASLPPIFPVLTLKAQPNPFPTPVHILYQLRKILIPKTLNYHIIKYLHSRVFILGCVSRQVLSRGLWLLWDWKILVFADPVIKPVHNIVRGSVFEDLKGLFGDLLPLGRFFGGLLEYFGGGRGRLFSAAGRTGWC